MQEDVRWNIKVSRETDLSLRAYLGAQGMKKGDLSKFIESAVKARIFHQSVEDIKSRNAKTKPAALYALIDEAVREVRAARRRPSKQRAAR